MKTNEKTSEEKLAEACYQLGPLILMACKHLTREEMMHQMEKKDNFYSLIATALNEEQELNLLELVKDAKKEVQYALILNPHLTDLIIDEIIRIGMPPVMQFLMENIKLTNSQLCKISENKHFAISLMAKSYL